ncbi:MAG: anaerobic ribonucleoside-triphosphate reductase [Anaeroplasmataceae bacterium]|nr:anaerobic ribonucleoside-triphosphate reductase [Anaeroplasmataceae bacterium]MDE6415386.1 anaerobic ribonucleoside-triphosphate reductase [Anaeroplasmataceae bacterium]
MKQLNNDNAANRNSYVGFVYNKGEQVYKNEILDKMPKEWAQLHREGYIHIHDLDAHGLTYNCLTLNIISDFPYKQFNGLNDIEKIIHLFSFIKELFTNLGNEQSGGMAFANFDNELAEVFQTLNIDIFKYKEILQSCIRELILWCNNNHTRMGQTSYYITFNIGLAKDEVARLIAFTLLDEFEKLGDLVFKPNIVFKVHKGISRFSQDKNFDLLKKSLLCTAKKMIPTYLLCDSKVNNNVDPNVLSIMGCRTRVVNDLYGNVGAIGRGNVANISINLPKIALEVDKDYPDKSAETRFRYFKGKWNRIAAVVKDILIDRYEVLCSLSKEDFPTNLEYQLWCESFKKAKNLKEIFCHGTLSIGFIGLSEAIEIITGKKYYEDMDNYVLALGFVKYMREYCDFLRGEYQLNFSLLATSGELISGRFIELDKKIFTPEIDIFSKGYYTNSFHIDVDSNLPGYKKIELEGLFHEQCNGGCITYIELGEAPISNDEGLLEYLEIAINAGTHYLGFNFPKDVCSNCQTSGIFDVCPNCGNDKITHIRRVSGYLEILDGFTNGKKNEVKARKAN